MELPTHGEADWKGNESLWGPNLNFLSVLWQPPPRDRVGQPVGGWLPSKSEKLWYASLLCWTTELLKAEVSQSFIYIWYDSECLCQYRGTLCQCCNSHGPQIAEAPGSHSHFQGGSKFSLFLSYSQPLCFCLSQSVAFEVSFKVNKWRTNVAVKSKSL